MESIAKFNLNFLLVIFSKPCFYPSSGLHPPGHELGRVYDQLPGHTESVFILHIQAQLWQMMMKTWDFSSPSVNSRCTRTNCGTIFKWAKPALLAFNAAISWVTYFCSQEDLICGGVTCTSQFTAFLAPERARHWGDQYTWTENIVLTWWQLWCRNAWSKWHISPRLLPW